MGDLTKKECASIESLMRELYEKECAKEQAEIKERITRNEYVEILGKLHRKLPTVSVEMAEVRYRQWKISNMKIP